MPEQKKPRTFQFHHERLRIDDSEHLLPAANVLLANGFAVWHERVARKGEITGVDLSEDFVCYCRLSDFDGEARMRVRMTDAELTCALHNPTTKEPCIRDKNHDGFCCDVNGSMFWDGRLYKACGRPNSTSGKACILGANHKNYCFDGESIFTIPLSATIGVCGEIHPIDEFGRCSLPANHEGDHKTGNDQGWPRATETTCRHKHPIEDIGGICILPCDHEGFHKTSANQGWFTAEGRDISYRCDSPDCPGYSWPHTRAPHPINTCPTKEHEPSKETA